MSQELLRCRRFLFPERNELLLKMYERSPETNMVDKIDFSCKHNILIRGKDGSLLPMDEPYYESKLIAPGTWCIMSDGDAQYLVEGDDEAIMIDSGYGAGNIRKYAQTLTEKPVRNIINTHDHFDHTANNAYFEKAYMSAATAPLATIPFPSFEGIDFPRDYPKEIVKQGDKIDLGGRTLEIIEMPDHAVGSICMLDSREGILFAGDEISDFFKKINTKVETVLEQFRYLASRKDEIKAIWPGSGKLCSPDLIDRYIETLEYILAGGEAIPGKGIKMPPKKNQENEGVVVYERFHGRPTDIKLDQDMKEANIRYVDQFGVKVIFGDGNL